MDISFLVFPQGSVAYTILLYSTVIFVGIVLGKVKIFNVSIGVTFVLFAGILAGHLGFVVESNVLHFIKEFGLILFVFTIGLQVGPSFFSSFKSGGVKMNLLGMSIIFLNVLIVILIFFIGTDSIADLTGIMSGAVTNTPGLGAAQEAVRQLFEMGEIYTIPQIALGYAVAYPFGVMGVILAMIIIRLLFKVDLKKEGDKLSHVQDTDEKPEAFSIRMTNSAMFDKKIFEIRSLIGRQFVVSRVKREGEYIVPNADTVIQKNDIMKVVSTLANKEAVVSFIGNEETNVDWEKSGNMLVSRRILITQDNINGKTLANLKLQSIYNVTITRINRSGINLMATPNLSLQVGDKVMVVGELPAIERVEKILGNTLKKLNEPHIATIFIGIIIGILFGSIPIVLPGIPMPVKLGLAGGPLIIAILLGRFGYKLKLITYTTMSANLMLREIGIALFLASVGIEAGKSFVETVISSNGLIWLGYGMLITFIPVISVGIFARKKMKMNYFTIIGIMAGSTTNPPALAYATSIAHNDEPAVAYSTVYPLTMFLRIIIAQLLILFLI